MIIKFRPVFKKCFSRTILQVSKPQKIFSISISLSACSQSRLFRSPVKFTKLSKTPLEENEESDESDENVQKESKEDAELDRLMTRAFLLPASGHQVFVVQPYIKWGRNKKRNTTPQLQLMESVTLVKTLRQWKVVDQVMIGLNSFNKKYFFGKGNLEELRKKVSHCNVISAVFISTNTLTLAQQTALEEKFRVPVFDRYTIIMHIFKEHAQTREAKLQIQLAQLPYLLRVLRGFNQGMGQKFGVSGSFFGGEGPKLLSDRQEVFKRRKAKIMKEIMELREQRQLNREKRDKSEIPTVAVIGYTNAGKTSLIKALTGKESLEPQDYLFATLDVTNHLGVLPSGLKVYYTDTLGFISDIPTYLIESFVATLEDATSAQIIIHVRDVSHPDTISQNDKVNEVLKILKLSEEAMANVIVVGNKIDLVEKDKLKDFNDMILVSSSEMTGIDFLRQEIEKRVLVTGEKIQMTIRVESGSEEYYWLHENVTVTDESPDLKNNQYMLINVIISASVLAKFKYLFIKSYKKKS